MFDPYKEITVGLLIKQYSTLGKECCSNACNWLVCFPVLSTPIQKLMLLATVQLLDTTFFERRIPGTCPRCVCC